MTGRCSKRNIQKNTGRFIVFWMSLCFLAGRLAGISLSLPPGWSDTAECLPAGLLQILLQDGSAAASILGVAAAYYRGPAAIYLLGHCRSGKFFLSVHLRWRDSDWLMQWQLFHTALGRCGVCIAMSVFGLRFFVVLPCMLFLADRADALYPVPKEAAKRRRMAVS